MLRARILKSGAFFTYFPIWWVAEFVPLSFRFTFRVIRFVADQLSLKLVVTKFFTPWKQSYNLPGWVSGLIVKSLYLVGALPFIFLVTLGVLIMNIIIVVSPVLAAFLLIYGVSGLVLA